MLWSFFSIFVTCYHHHYLWFMMHLCHPVLVQVPAFSRSIRILLVQSENELNVEREPWYKSELSQMDKIAPCHSDDFYWICCWHYLSSLFWPKDIFFHFLSLPYRIIGLRTRRPLEMINWCPERIVTYTRLHSNWQSQDLYLSPLTPNLLLFLLFPILSYLSHPSLHRSIQVHVLSRASFDYIRP